MCVSKNGAWEEETLQVNHCGPRKEGRKVARLGFEPRSAGPKPAMMDPYTIGLCKSVGAVPLFVFVGFGFTAKAHGRQVFFERSQ